MEEALKNTIISEKYGLSMRSSVFTIYGTNVSISALLCFKEKGFFQVFSIFEFYTYN